MITTHTICYRLIQFTDSALSALIRKVSIEVVVRLAKTTTTWCDITQVDFWLLIFCCWTVHFIIISTTPHTNYTHDTHISN